MRVLFSGTEPEAEPSTASNQMNMHYAREINEKYVCSGDESKETTEWFGSAENGQRPSLRHPGLPASSSITDRMRGVCARLPCTQPTQAYPRSLDPSRCNMPPKLS